jgi:tuftelin-interacting protein 11
MSKSLDSLYGTIRHKLSNALQNWHPSDSSAKAILLPWKTVFTSNSWDIFMNKNIVPKLEKCLIEFEINPRQQNIEPWKWVMDWEALIPTNSFINLIDRTFFPKWLEVLSIWLNSRPNYEEVSRWYLGKLKKLF